MYTPTSLNIVNFQATTGNITQVDECLFNVQYLVITKETHSTLTDDVQGINSTFYYSISKALFSR